MRYTKYIDQCARELQESASYPTDNLVVELVRVQHLTDRINQLNMRDGSVDELPGIPIVPAEVYRAAFQAELERLQRSLTPTLESNCGLPPCNTFACIGPNLALLQDLLMVHYGNAQLRLYEHAMGDWAALDANSTIPCALLASLNTNPHLLNSVPSPSSGQREFDAIYRLRNTLAATFDHLVAVPVCYFFYFPLPVSTMILYGITMMCRWVKMLSSKNPALAEMLGRPELRIDVSGALDRLADRFEAAGREMKAAHGVWNNSRWDLGASKIRAVKSKLEKMCHVIAIVGGEGILLRKYENLEVTDREEEHPGTNTAESNGERAPAEGGEATPGCVQADMLWSSDLWYGMDDGPGLIFDFSREWAMPWMNAELEVPLESGHPL